MSVARRRPPRIVALRFALSLFVAALLLQAAPTRAHRQLDHRVVLGWLEWITIEPWGFAVKTRLDTGAQTASLHAEDIRRFRRDDQTWVRFTLAAPDAEDGNDIEVERPLTRDVLIKEPDGGHDRRPVVIIKICLNGERHKTEFSLNDRSALSYPALLGRRFLAGIALVDPAQTFLASRQCPQ